MFRTKLLATIAIIVITSVASFNVAYGDTDGLLGHASVQDDQGTNDSVTVTVDGVEVPGDGVGTVAAAGGEAVPWHGAADEDAGDGGGRDLPRGDFDGAGPAGAAAEGGIPDTADAVRNRDAREVGAALEGMCPNAGDTIRERDSCQAGAVVEGIIPDAGDALKPCQVGQQVIGADIQITVDTGEIPERSQAGQCIVVPLSLIHI